MKYGSFIPLSEKDVVEYLKNKGNSDLSSRSACNTNTATHTLLRQASSSQSRNIRFITIQ